MALETLGMETKVGIHMVNLTPHEITIVKDGVVDLKIPSLGLARVASKEVIVGMVNGIPETETIYGEVEGLPEPKEGVLYIVSRLVLGRCEGRTDLRVPGKQVRDNEGRVIGCESLARN